MHRTVPLFRPYGVREARMEDEMDELIRLALNEVQALFAHWESFYGESLRLLVSGPAPNGYSQLWCTRGTYGQRDP